MCTLFWKSLRSEFKTKLFIRSEFKTKLPIIKLSYPLYSCGNNSSFKATSESISKIRLGLAIPDRFTSILQTKEQTDTCK